MICPIRQPGAWLSLGLAFVGGYGDAAGFVLARTFTGHVTGNLVLGAISVAAWDGRAVLGHLVAIVAFLTGILLSVLIARPLNAWTSWRLVTTVMAIEVVLIVVACFVLAPPVAARMTFVVCVSLALGLQNGAFRRVGGISVHTTYLTGMITGVITTATEKYAAEAVSRPVTTPDPKTKLLPAIWIAFVVGAGIGAGMAFHFKKFGMLGMALVLMVCILSTSKASPIGSPN